MTWWETFFDDAYRELWSHWTTAECSAAEAAVLWELAGLREGARVLDAPCGYGRIARPLADAGASVLGVDQSAALLAHAEAARGPHDVKRLRYLRHDLREPLAEGGFDAVLDIFSSLGYGTEEDDLAILGTLARALAPGGRLIVETMHRDQLCVRLAHQHVPASRTDDGTLVLEQPRFDPVAGRVETTWYWSGPRGSGSKSASLRVYCVTELARLIERVGLRVADAKAGLSTEPYRPQSPTRIALVAERR